MQNINEINVNEIKALSDCSGKRLSNTPFEMTIDIKIDIAQETLLPIKPALYTHWYRSCTTTQEGITRRPKTFVDPKEYTLRYQEFLLKSALDIKKANAKAAITITFPDPKEYTIWYKQKTSKNLACFATYTQQPTPEEYEINIYPNLINALENLEKTPQEACSTILSIFQGDNNNQAQSNNNETGITIDQSTATKTEKTGKDVLIIVSPQNARLKNFINGKELIPMDLATFTQVLAYPTTRPLTPTEYIVWFNENFPQGRPTVGQNIFTPEEYTTLYPKLINAQPIDNIETTGNKRGAEDNDDTTEKPNAYIMQA